MQCNSRNRFDSIRARTRKLRDEAQPVRDARGGGKLKRPLDADHRDRHRGPRRRTRGDDDPTRAMHARPWSARSARASIVHGLVHQVTIFFVLRRATASMDGRDIATLCVCACVTIHDSPNSPTPTHRLAISSRHDPTREDDDDDESRPRWYPRGDGCVATIPYRRCARV